MAYKKVTVKIPNVTGNIVVNVTTQGSIQNLFDVNNSILNARIGAAGDIKPAGNTAGMLVTNLIDLTDINTRIDFSGITFVPNSSLSYAVREVTYDSSGTTVVSQNNYANPIYSINVFELKTAHTNIKYVRFGLSVKDGTSITVDDVANLVIIGS